MKHKIAREKHTVNNGGGGPKKRRFVGYLCANEGI